MPEQMYVIAWEHKQTALRGRGTMVMPEELAKTCVFALNNQYPHLNHWIEPVPTKEP